MQSYKKSASQDGAWTDCLLNQSVIGAAASFFGAAKDAFVDKVLYVAQGGGCGGLGHLGPFAGVELAFKPIPKPVDDFDLPFVKRLFKFI